MGHPPILCGSNNPCQLNAIDSASRNFLYDKNFQKQLLENLARTVFNSMFERQTIPIGALNASQGQGVVDDPVVISGIGMVSCLGGTREEIWQAIQLGRSGIRLTKPDDGVGRLRIPCGMVDCLPPNDPKLKSIRMCRVAANEAIDDADLDWRKIDRGRFACSIAAQFGDIRYLYLTPEQQVADPETLEHPWHNEFLPCTITHTVAGELGLYGPRLSYATACASGVVSLLSAARMIEEDQADLALAGAADSVQEIIMTAFYRMGVLAENADPASACRPFDKTRSGFVMGEGAALMVLERKSHAIARGAKIYAEIASGHMLCQAHHVTSWKTIAKRSKH